MAPVVRRFPPSLDLFFPYRDFIEDRRAKVPMPLSFDNLKKSGIINVFPPKKFDWKKSGKINPAF
jgi:hypothetical protein